MAKDLAFNQKKDIIIAYLQGDKLSDIAKKFEISSQQIHAIIRNEDATRLELEKKFFYLPVARESKRISQVKEKIIDFIEASLDEGIDTSNKHLFIDKFKGMLDTLDRIQRLNSDMPTENTKQTNINVDVAKLTRELKTPEDKKQFLLNQLRNGN